MMTIFFFRWSSLTAYAVYRSIVEIRKCVNLKKSDDKKGDKDGDKKSEDDKKGDKDGVKKSDDDNEYTNQNHQHFLYMQIQISTSCIRDSIFFELSTGGNLKVL